jgi:hypothetical protein
MPCCTGFDVDPLPPIEPVVPKPIQRGNWRSTDIVDMFGNQFAIGDKVARAYTSGRSSNLEIRTVTRIENGHIYLNGSHVAINYPGRLLIVTKLFN